MIYKPASISPDFWPHRIALMLCGFLLVSTIFSPPGGADQPTNKALVTDKANLPLSDQFAPPGQIRLTNSGDVFFAPGGFAFFRWSSGSGSRTRLLQGGDPLPGFPGSVCEVVGNSLQTNSSGHAAMLNFFALEDARNPRGLFVYDGASFLKVALRDEIAPGTGGQLFSNFTQFRINDSDQVGFQASFDSLPNNSPVGIFIGAPNVAPVKVAVTGETAPGTGGGVYSNLQLIGFNNAGQVAFLSDITGGTTIRAVFIGTTSGVSKVAATLDPATGTTGFFNLLPVVTNYALNENGDLAFRSIVSGIAPSAVDGIWIGNSSAPPTKLLGNNDLTGSSLGGSFGVGVTLRGFNNAGKVLFQSNPVGATSNHALFLKDLSNPTQVVFARNQSAPGGTTETFLNTLQASLNDSGDVAFLAQLQGGSAPFGYFLGSGAALPIKIALQGEATPVGGTYGLAGLLTPAQINNVSQVAFTADVLGPNTTGAFSWTPGGGTVSIVNTNDTLPEGANPIIRTFMPGASDDRFVFRAFKAGGRSIAFTEPIEPGGGKTTRIVGEGDSAPGIGGALYGVSAEISIINDNEEAAFATNRVIGASVYPAGVIFTHKPGVGLQKVAATGDTAPGTGGGTFLSFGSVQTPPSQLNSQGQVAFFANIAGSAGNASRNGVFIGSVGGVVQAVARMGDVSPIGGAFANITNTDISLNESGQVTFHAISQSGITQTPAIFTGSVTASPVKVVARGDAGPGGSIVNVIPLNFQMNNAGQVVYVAGLVGGSSPEGIFLGTAGGAQASVALAGAGAPGSGGGVFSDFRDFDIELNNSGAVAFRADITGGTASSGVYLGSASAPPAPRLIEGQPLPGGGTVGPLTPALNFIGEPFALTESGEMSIFVFNVSGAPNLPGHVIADPAGVLREFVTVGKKAQGTGSDFGITLQAVATNSTGRFFFSAILVNGQTRWGVFADK
jgi:hypothetical protein